MLLFAVFRNLFFFLFGSDRIQVNKKPNNLPNTP